QTTQGEKEEEIINRLSKVIETISDNQHDARQKFPQKKSNTLCDQIDRANDASTYAQAMESKEARILPSMIQLNMDFLGYREDRENGSGEKGRLGTGHQDGRQCSLYPPGQKSAGARGQRGEGA